MAWYFNIFTGMLDYYMDGVVAAPDGVLLMENGDYITLEDDNYLASE